MTDLSLAFSGLTIKTTTEMSLNQMKCPQCHTPAVAIKNKSSPIVMCDNDCGTITCSNPQCDIDYYGNTVGHNPKCGCDSE